MFGVWGLGFWVEGLPDVDSRDRRGCRDLEGCRFFCLLFMVQSLGLRI